MFRRDRVGQLVDGESEAVEDQGVEPLHVALVGAARASQGSAQPHYPPGELAWDVGLPAQKTLSSFLTPSRPSSSL
jgi:hypothetical protein